VIRLPASCAIAKVRVSNVAGEYSNAGIAKTVVQLKFTILSSKGNISILGFLNLTNCNFVSVIVS